MSEEPCEELLTHTCVGRSAWETCCLDTCVQPRASIGHCGEGVSGLSLTHSHTTRIHGVTTTQTVGMFGLMLARSSLLHTQLPTGSSGTPWRQVKLFHSITYWQPLLRGRLLAVESTVGTITLVL